MILDLIVPGIALILFVVVIIVYVTDDLDTIIDDDELEGRDELV